MRDSVNQQLLISDANILIDITVGGLLEAMFKLSYAFAVPDVLFHDELRDQNPKLPGKGLRILELKEQAIVDTAQLNVKHAKTGVSSNDCMALALAKQEGCPLLTGDRALRQVCLAEDVEVRGTIWLVGEMFEAGLVTLQQVEQAYAAMRADGSRLPWDEIDRQIKEFEKK